MSPNFLVDNLVRTQKKRDPESARTKSIQLCTLPITVKGLPRNSKITDSWHSGNCDGSSNCSCKDNMKISKKDVFDTFLSLTEEEETQMLLFRQEAIWGMNFILQDTLIRPLLEASAEKHKPLPIYEVATEDMTISFQDMSLQEVDRVDEADQDLEKSLSGMSMGDDTGLGQEQNEGGEEAEEEEKEEEEDEEEGEEEANDDSSDLDTDTSSNDSIYDSDIDQSNIENAILSKTNDAIQLESSDNQLAESFGANGSQSYCYQPDFENIETNQMTNMSVEEDENELVLSAVSIGNNRSSFI